MNLESGNFARCARHPTQIFTGFCSSCLAERLSNMGATERSLKAPCSSQSEIIEVPDVIPEVEKKPNEIRVRRTLQYLFELDDGLGVDSDEQSAENQLVLSTSNAYECKSSFYGGGANHFKDANIKLSSCRGTEVEVSDSNAAQEIKIRIHIDKEINGGEDEKLKDQSSSFRLSSMFAKKGILRRMKSISKKDEMQDDKLSNRFDDKQLESSPNSRHSCDWGLCHDSHKSSWDPPRHSWDGSMVARALACSFTCLEEREDDLRRLKRNLPGETMSGNPNQTCDNMDSGKVNNMPMANDKHFSSDGSLEALFVERLYEESQPGNPVSRIRWKRSHRWSKVWDWSITNSFRDLVKKHEHVLQRSASETWQGRKNNNVDSMESDSGLQINGNHHGSVGVNHCLRQSINAGNGDLKNRRSDWQMKSEFKIGRCRSLHYPSPGNLDNSLLRFYLTPLRSSRRCKSKGRSRTKNLHLLERGIFGLY